MADVPSASRVRTDDDTHPPAGPIEIPDGFFMKHYYGHEEFKDEVEKLGLGNLLGPMKNLGRLYRNFQQEYTWYGEQQTRQEFQRALKEVEHSIKCTLKKERDPGSWIAGLVDATKLQQGR